MKQLFSKAFLPVAFLFLLLASSCNFARFDRYPGQKLEAIPDTFQGTFYAVAGKKSANKGDDTSFVVVSKQYYQEYNQDKPRSPKEKKVLNKDFLVTSYRGLTFLATFSETDSLWDVFVLEPSKTGFTVRTMPDITPEDRQGKNDKAGKYKRYFNEKSRIEHSGRVVWYYEMNEEKLYECYQKKLRKLDGIKFIRTR